QVRPRGLASVRCGWRNCGAVDCDARSRIGNGVAVPRNDRSRRDVVPSQETRARTSAVSIRLVLTHYLATLRERNELDALLPELLVAMGHNVLSRAQVGVPQGGVDVLSSLAAPGGQEEAFLFIIKFGDIG